MTDKFQSISKEIITLKKELDTDFKDTNRLGELIGRVQVGKSFSFKKNLIITTYLANTKKSWMETLNDLNSKCSVILNQEKY